MKGLQKIKLRASIELSSKREGLASGLRTAAPAGLDAAVDTKQLERRRCSRADPDSEIFLKVFTHCEGSARKVRRCLKGFEGVENVITDCIASKVVVKGEREDPMKVFKRVQRKSHRHVELISPIPKAAVPPEEPHKPPEKKRGLREEGRENKGDSWERLRPQPPPREENR